MQFNVILQYHDELLHGLWLTVQISVVSIVLGTALGILAATARQMSGRPTRLIVDSYVEIIRNTPFLVQLFIIFFGFPTIGLRIGATSAARPRSCGPGSSRSTPRSSRRVLPSTSPAARSTSTSFWRRPWHGSGRRSAASSC